MLFFTASTKAKCKGTTEETSVVPKDTELIVNIFRKLINCANV